jgi:chitin deacetylase
MKSKNKKISIVLCLVVVLLIVCFGLFKISKSRTFQFFGGLTGRVETDQKVVALTFDDAPTAKTGEVLEILKQKNIKATFFAVGGAIEDNSEIAKQIVDDGHQLANHSYSHQRFLLKSLSFTKNEIEKTNELIRSAGYDGEIVFRPPNGKKLFILPWYLRQNKIKTVMWNVEPDSYASGNAQNITKYTLENTTPGSIILMHPFCESDCEADREALPLIIDGLRDRGYVFVTVNELIGV